MNIIHTFNNSSTFMVPLCTFDFSRYHELHTDCISEYCTKRRGLVCLTPKFYDYLGNYKKAYLNKKYCKACTDENDQYYLKYALENPGKSLSKRYSGIFFI